MEDQASLSRVALSGEADLGGLIGQSAPMHVLNELIAKVSRSTFPVLLIGVFVNLIWPLLIFSFGPTFW